MSELLHSAERRIAVAAAALVSLFPAVVIALNVVQRHDYHPSVQAISELALGRDGEAMIAAFLGLGAGIAFTGVLVRRRAPRERVVPMMLYVVAFLAGPMSAFFHTDRSGSHPSWHGRLHDGSGIAAFVLVLLSMYVAAWRLRREPALRSAARVSLVWALSATPAFFLVPLMPAHFGLAQRVYVAVFVTWFVALDGRLASASSDAVLDLPRTPARPSALPAG